MASGERLVRAVNNQIGLKEYSSTPAISADGQQVDLPTYTCHLDWFGRDPRKQSVRAVVERK